MENEVITNCKCGYPYMYKHTLCPKCQEPYNFKRKEVKQMKIKIPKDLTPPPVPNAVYKATIEPSEFKLGKSTAGNDMISARVTILSQGPTEVVTVGRKIQADHFTFGEDALWKLDQLLFAATGTHLKEQEIEIDDLYNMVVGQVGGREFLVRVEAEMYQGTPRPKIQEYRRIQG